jgi:hypothetical protein
VLLLAYGMASYVADKLFLESAIRAEATIEGVRDESGTYGGMSRFGGSVHSGHECDYTVQYRRPRGENYTVAQLKILSRSCLAEGSRIAILYDPQNPQAIELPQGVDETMPVGEIFIIFGVMVLGLSYVAWLHGKQRERSA